MRTVGAGILGLVVIAAVPAPQATAQRPAPAIVSPNLRLIPGEHNEPWIAVSPTDPNVLIAAAQQGGGTPGPPRFAVSTMISRDGGRRWTTVTLPKPGDLPFDPMVGAGPNGDLYVIHGVIGGDFLSALGIKSDAKPTIRFWSSTDGGWTWNVPTDLAASVPPDHMRLTVDMSNGPHRGRIYIAWNDVADQFVRDQYEIFLQYSDDRGKTFTEPILVATGTDGKLVATEPVVLSDGTLLVTWYQYFNPLARAENEKMPFYVRRSTDGAKSFAPAEKIFEFGPHIARYHVSEYSRAFSLPIVTADTSSRSGFRDRIYIAWDDARKGGGESDIWFVRSLDKGRSWSAAKRLNDNTGASPLGFPDFRHTPVVAVAPDGTIGILWYDGRDDPARRCWELYFTRSTDGGDSFSANQKITTAPSCPPPALAPQALVHNLSARGRDPNVPPDSIVDRMNLITKLGFQTVKVNQQARDEWEARLTDGRLTLSFGAARNIFAGHYTGMAADRDGNFHALWLDRRSGMQELHTARLTFGAPRPVSGSPTDVTRLVEVVAGTPTYDAATGRIKVPVQIRNASNQTIAGPITLRIVGVSEVAGKKAAAFVDSAVARASTPEFTFAGKLGSADRLEPGDMSEPLEIAIAVKAETGLDAALDFRVFGVSMRR